jgi:16S rRNA (guanine527-N7)-methyltransferase
VITSEEEARAFVAARCDAGAMQRLDRLVEMLRVENTRQNLVSRGSLDAMWRRHIADSAQLLDHVSRETGPWLDLGTGAGFPGIIVAAMRPERAVILVESRKRRIEWLRGLVAPLGLTNCRIEGARVEAVSSFPATIISARAFAPLDKLLALAARFSTSDTLWLLPKGRSAAQEVASLPKPLQKVFHVEQSVTDADSGIVVGRMTRDGVA